MGANWKQNKFFFNNMSVIDRNLYDKVNNIHILFMNVELMPEHCNEMNYQTLFF